MLTSSENVMMDHEAVINRLRGCLFLHLQRFYFYLFITLYGNCQESMRHFYLIKPVEGGAFLHELWQVFLPVKFVGLRHGCSQT